ncbi:Ser/Thr protein phosphatase superfamily [Xylariaceae sp. FL0804]|nr:Ser/Thr protein phosphatase superfamily [Xylariaceae sp. FL0804]
MVAIQIVSDLHLESPKAYDVFEIPPRAPHLALLGDIGYARDEEEYTGFLRTQLRNFRTVFLVLGNHEPWHLSWEAARDKLRRFERIAREERAADPRLGSFVLLDKTRYDLEGPGGESITILGCTLFSRVPAESLEAVSFGVNDFYLTEDWTVEQHTATFEEELQWVNSQVAEAQNAGRRCVVFTHYSPTADQRATEPRYANDPKRSGFRTELRGEGCFRSQAVGLWAFGHTHFNCDFVDEETGTRVLANQRGMYFSQSAAFEVGKTVEL